MTTDDGEKFAQMFVDLTGQTSITESQEETPSHRELDEDEEESVSADLVETLRENGLVDALEEFDDQSEPR